MSEIASDAPPELELAFKAVVKIGPGIEVGQSGGGRKRIVPITGGQVMGRVEGSILEGGADWQTIRPDGVTDVWARYTIRTTDGANIIVTNAGIRRASADVSARLAAGERIDPWRYYFRAAPVFETGSKTHRWLTESLFVCVGERWPLEVILKVYEVR